MGGGLFSHTVDPGVALNSCPVTVKSVPTDL